MIEHSCRGIPRFALRIFLAACLSAAAATPACADEKATMAIASFGGVWQQTLEKALQPFAKENNVEIRLVPGSSQSSTARAIAQRNNQEFDLVFGEDLSLGLGRQAHVWEKLDPAIVTNLKDVAAEARMPGDMGVAVVIFRIGMFYRTDAFQKNSWASPTSWFDLLDPKYCHRVGLNDPKVSHTYFALMMLGGGKPDDFPKGVDILAKHMNCIDTLDPSAQKTLQKVQIGDYDIGVTVDAFAETLAARGVPVKFVRPKEGAILQPTTVVIPKGAPHPVLAQKLVNELLSQAMQKTLMSVLNGTPANKTVDVGKEKIAAGALDPKDMSGYVTIKADEIIDKRNQYLLEAEKILGK
jgi:putative spermidine/putrescine transport system substrate-binding protein